MDTDSHGKYFRLGARRASEQGRAWWLCVILPNQVGNVEQANMVKASKSKQLLNGFQ